jgi:predicted permease
MALGWILKRAFKFPAWTVPAICFNNTTALPLLLIQSLETSGILSDLTMGAGDTTTAAVRRAKSYFLVSSIVGNSLTFAIGPRLLDDEESPDNDSQKKKDQDRNQAERQNDEEHADPTNSEGRTAEQEEEHDTETTTLLPNVVARKEDEVSQQWGKQWGKLPLAVQKTLGFLGMFLNGPLIGAMIGATLGLVPPLHRAFFNEPSEGGIFKAWLTASVSNVGELFAALQLVVVGAKLSRSLMKTKKGEASGTLPKIPMFTVFFIRFILWPV